MVRANEVKEAEICPCNAGEEAVELENASRSLRMAVDCRWAELKSAFYQAVSVRPPNM